jgi:hypothetical protein
VRIVGVEDCSSAAELTEYGWEDAGVEPGSPANRPHSHTGRAEAVGQLGISPGDDDLIDATPGEFAGQQPDLPLSTTPLPAGGDVDDGGSHVPGNASVGKGSLSRTAAWGPLSRTTSASRLRSSARLNGLCR